MKIHVEEERRTYDGTQLSSLFAFRNYRVQGDSVSVFRGPCHVAITEMVDLADVLANDYIFSEDMLHFIIEHFDMNLEMTVTRQRLLIAIIKECLEDFGITQIKRSGDDIFLGAGKLSVSIATLSPISSMIHTGLNISSQNTPVRTVSLQDLGITDFLGFGRSIAERYSAEVTGIKAARCKVRGVE